MCSSLEMLEASKSASGSYRHFLTHTTDKAMMERKTRYEVQSYCREYGNEMVDGSIEFLTNGIKLEICVMR